jgi:RES domain-containing protein
MLVCRITHKDYSKSLLASGIEGRWNSAGKKVIYCAESVALAFLENMIRRQGAGFNNLFRIMIVEIPDDLAIQTIKPADIKAGWRDSKNYSFCQVLGDRWFQDGKVPVLRVPSAVLPQSCNYVINTTHTDYKKIRLLKTTHLIPDPRIDEILKNTSSK